MKTTTEFKEFAQLAHAAYGVLHHLNNHAKRQNECTKGLRVGEANCTCTGQIRTGT